MLVLDLGCGTYCRGDVGVDIQFWYRHPLDQPEKFDFLFGSRNPYCDRVLADLNYPLPFRDDAFDLVLARAVLEHILRPYDLLLEVRRVLRRGGRLKLVVPNARVSMSDWRDEGHVYSFTVPTITRLVSKTLRVVKVELLFNEESIYLEAVKE